MYQCPICQKVFTGGTSLNYHISNKVCQKINNKRCHKCGQIFSTKQMCRYHILHEVCDDMKKHKPKLTLKTKYDDMSKEELVIKLIQSETEIRKLRENPTTHIGNNVNVVVFPNAFGQENMELITQKLGDIIGPLIKNRPHNTIPALFSQIHDNDKLPEYRNVYLPNERSSYALVSDGKKFVYRPKKNVIDQIIEEKRSLINSYIDNNGDQFGEKVLKKYDTYQERLDDNEEFRKELEMEIGGLLLNMKSIIANDEKTRQLLEKVGEGDFELHTDDV